MFKNPEIIHVFMDEQKVGRIGLGKDYLAVFEYDPAFINNGFSISPFYLPLRSGVFLAKREPFDGLFGIFNDSLPDSWGNLLLDRYLKSKGVDISPINVLGRLSIIGNSGMGSLSYQPKFESLKASTVHQIEEYATEVKKILGEKEYQENIEDLFQQGGSSGGARPKIMMQVEGEPWIVKFPSPYDDDDYGIIEYQYSEVAKKCGIIMPETRLFDGKYFGVKRFDVSEGKKIHMHSVAGLLYANYRYPSLDYKDLFTTCLALTKNMGEVDKLFRQMVFNVLTGNKDDHSKNFSFLFQNGRWSLSPAYDLVRNIGFNGQHTSTIAGKGNPEISDLFMLADHANMSKKIAKEIFDEVFENCLEIRLDRF